MINYTAEQIFEGRIALAKFLHNEVKEILDIVIDDLITDAQFYAMSLFGYTVVDGTDFTKKMSKAYEKRRKERVNIIRGKGRPRGKSLSQEELNAFIGSVESIIRKLDEKGKRVTKTAIAREIYVGHSNAVQQLNRFFKRYDMITFDKILDNYRIRKQGLEQ